MLIRDDDVSRRSWAKKFDPLVRGLEDHTEGIIFVDGYVDVMIPVRVVVGADGQFFNT